MLWNLYTDFRKFNSSDSTMARINLNYSEEVFLQRSLREVVLIWNRGTGQADFNLRVRNGMAELHLGFQLGHPRDPHFIQPKRNPSKPKGPKQKERDRKRAAAYQARAFESQESGDGSAVSANSLNPEASSESSMASLNTSQTLPSASSSLSSSTEPADVISPLSTTLPVVDPSPTTSIASVDLSFLPPAASVDTSPPNLATSQVVPAGVPALFAAVRPPQVAVVHATAVFVNCPHQQLVQEDVDSLQRFLLSESHLKQNIVKVNLENLSSRSFRNDLFTHTLSVEMHVDTARLSETPVSYLQKHVGKSEWKRSNGTLISLTRIHA